MNHYSMAERPSDEQKQEHETKPGREGISPLNPSTFPRAEDDEDTLARSPEFHDLPDPGPNAGRDDPSPATERRSRRESSLQR